MRGGNSGSCLSEYLLPLVEPIPAVTEGGRRLIEPQFEGENREQYGELTLPQIGGVQFRLALVQVKDFRSKISSFASAPPSNEFADAITRRFPPHVLHQAGANSKSSLKRTT